MITIAITLHRQAADLFVGNKGYAHSLVRWFACLVSSYRKRGSWGLLLFCTCIAYVPGTRTSTEKYLK